MNEQMRDALRNASDKVAAIEALWQSLPPRTCVNGIRIPDEVRDLAQVTRLLLEVVASQQEELEALKERRQ